MKLRTEFALAVVALASASVAQANPIVIGDKEWRQLTETTGLSWHDLASNCDTVRGICSGSLESVELDDWTWADIVEIGDLFATLTPFPGGITGYSDSNGAFTWGGNFLALFEYTRIINTTTSVVGMTRDSENPQPHLGEVYIREDGFAEARTNVNFLLGDRSSSSIYVGAWMYRNVTPVPEPGSLALLGFGLAGLGLARRRKPHG